MTHGSTVYMYTDRVGTPLPMAKTRTPKYRRQHRKSGDLAFVELGGSRHYLGRFDTPESHEAYHRLLAEWQARGRSVLSSKREISVSELIAAFIRHAERYYRRPDHSLTGESENFKLVLRPLRTSLRSDCYCVLWPVGIEGIGGDVDGQANAVVAC